MKERLEAWLQRTQLGFVVWRTANQYSEDNIGIRAGMIAYFLFLSIFPLLLLLISLVGFVIPPERAVTAVGQLLADFPPTVRQLVLDNVLSAYDLRGSVTLIGLLLLSYSASQVYFAINYALNAIWDTVEDRPWYRLYARALGVVGVSLVLVGGIVFLDTVSQTFGRVLTPWLPDVVLADMLSFAALALSLLGSFALFVAIYRWVPRRRVGWRYLWVGAAVATVLWKVSKTVFGWYLQTLSGNEAVYGSIGVIITLLLWLYFSAVIFLVGAEVNHALADWHAHELVQRPPVGRDDEPGAA